MRDWQWGIAPSMSLWLYLPPALSLSLCCKRDLKPEWMHPVKWEIWINTRWPPEKFLKWDCHLYHCVEAVFKMQPVWICLSWNMKFEETREDLRARWNTRLALRNCSNYVRSYLQPAVSLSKDKAFAGGPYQLAVQRFLPPIRGPRF